MFKGQSRELKRGWVFQQDNDPNHTSKSTMKYFLERQMKVLEWAPRSPDLNIIENLWRDPKYDTHATRPKNISDLEMFCQEELGKIPKARIEILSRLLSSLQEVQTDRVPKLLHRDYFLSCSAMLSHVCFIFSRLYLMFCI